MPEHTVEERAKRKEEREDKAGKLLKEKGGEMNRAEKAFVGNFAKKDQKPSADIPKEKAKQILKEGEVGGKPLSEKQKGLFGAAAGKGEK